MISYSPVLLLLVVVLSVGIAVSVYYGIRDDSSVQRRRRRGRQRDEHRRAMEESRRADAERNAEDRTEGAVSNDDAVKNWLDPEQEAGE